MDRLQVRNFLALKLLPDESLQHIDIDRKRGSGRGDDWIPDWLKANDDSDIWTF